MKPFTQVPTVILFCSFLLLRCSNLAPIAGATDMPNETASVSAVIHDSAGAPVYGAVVTMVHAEYLAPLPQTAGSNNRGIFMTMTDESGHFVVDSLDSGSYTIEVNDRTNSACRIHCTIGNDTGTKKLGTFAVQPYAAISGKIDTTGMPAAQRYLQIYGLNRIVPVESSGFFSIGGLPADLFTIRIVSINTAVEPIDISGIRLIPGETKNLYAPWAQSMKINLNTTLSGAGVSGNVYGFPMLVRLNATNFNFSSAQIDGRDVRFTKPDNTVLPYEIERWDPAAGLAEVWVKVDTVRGDDSIQSITMHWGNPDAADESNGAAVFDTVNGFAAVWHLDTGCSDATAGNNGGTSFGATDTVGIIGGAKKFDGSSYIQVAGLLGAPPSITISAWVRLDSTSGSGQDIVSVGDAVAIRAYRTAPDGTAGFFCSNVSSSDTVHVFTNTGADILKTGWRYLVYTVDGARHVQSMYIDGTFQSSTNDSNPIDYGLGLNTVLGAHGNKKTQSYAFGCIDEARVCRVARSADWIKLCYMNQKEQDALVKFR